MSQALQEVAAQDTPCSVAALCRAIGVPRATYYRHRATGASVDPDLWLRDQIQQIAVEMPAYGYRRITAALQRQGIRVNRKRVLRLMRQDNLLCLRKKRFVPTTNSEHGFCVYPNLAAALGVTGIDPLWVADITYVRLESEFVYLAVLLDAYSRRVIG